MRIKKVHIKNYRCLEDVEIDFDNITTFIGPNGVGKSSVLRALNWFFNGDKNLTLTADDLYSGVSDPENSTIIVKVEFDNLTESDRTALGRKYAPPNTDVFTVWRIWENGVEKITGRAKAYPPFERIRSITGAKEQKIAYEELIQVSSELNLPRWTNAAAVKLSMEMWERDNPDQLSDAEVSGTHFFGFASQAKLSGLFDFVLVTADLRASEESQDSKGSIIGRIIEKAVNRSVATEQIDELSTELIRRYESIQDDHITPQLTDLSERLTREVNNFTSGRTINIKSEKASFTPPPPKFILTILDHLAETSVSGQGHGFQRALLIAALKMLAERQGENSNESVLCLAIEEPELFQHPSQCKAFAQVLRDLTPDATSGMQVTYATHSPYFIEPVYFDQVRRVKRVIQEGTHTRVSISQATIDSVCEKIAAYEKVDSIRHRLELACTNELSKAIFAEAVILVEGSCDGAIIDGIAARTKHLSIDGIEVAECGGKGNIIFSHAILTSLNIPCYAVFDCDEPIELKEDGDKNYLSKIKSEKGINSKLLKYLGEREIVDGWPGQRTTPIFTSFRHSLEPLLNASWPEWDVKCQELLNSGRGVSGKNARTYFIAAKETETEPPAILSQIIQHTRNLITA